MSKQLFNTEIADSFCKFCGAGIPHRMGEGRCEKCIQHLPPEEYKAHFIENDFKFYPNPEDDEPKV